MLTRLLQLSSLLELGNGNTLKQLADQTRKENHSIRVLTEKSTQDAAAVKVLTIITLIYLPATVVSVSPASWNYHSNGMLNHIQNFFSTQFVSQEHYGDGVYVVLGANAWLFAAISVPLTLSTLAVWWVWVRFQACQATRTDPTTRREKSVLFKELFKPRRSIESALTDKA